LRSLVAGALALRLRAIGRRRTLQTRVLYGRGLKDQHGLRHLADFVFLVLSRYGDLEVARSELFHRRAHGLQRATDGAGDKEGDQAAEQNGRRGDDFLNGDRAGDRARALDFIRLLLLLQFNGEAIDRVDARDREWSHSVAVSVARLERVCRGFFERGCIVRQSRIDRGEQRPDIFWQIGLLQDRDLLARLVDICAEVRNTFGIERREKSPVCNSRQKHGRLEISRALNDRVVAIIASSVDKLYCRGRELVATGEKGIAAGEFQSNDRAERFPLGSHLQYRFFQRPIYDTALFHMGSGLAHAESFDRFRFSLLCFLERRRVGVD
jgi:hypothetical protein